MLKIDLHTHSSEDPLDKGFSYDARWLIDRAAQKGFNALAITLHDKVIYTPALGRYARQKGLLLIPGCEATIEGKHVLLYNITETERSRIKTFEDLRRLRALRGDTMLCIAPHPCHPNSTSLGMRLARQNIDLFDGIELSQYAPSWVDWVRAAARLGRTHGKTLVATSDAHSMRFFDTCYSYVDAQQSIASIMDAVRAGRVRPVHKPLNWWDTIYLMSCLAELRLRRLIGLESNYAF